MSTDAAAASRAAITELLGAIESRDLRKISRALSPEATWQNVPHPPAHGRDAVVELLGSIVCWSDEVHWEVTSESYAAGRAWLERVDRFLLDGQWYEVQCNGVFDVDDAGLVRQVRDYVDLGEWRSRVEPVFERLAGRPATEVVRRHLDAVGRGDAVAMAADYAVDAVLVRGESRYDGWERIADYFDGVPARLGGRRVDFHDVITTESGSVETRWTLDGDDAAPPAKGIDTFVVSDGRIVRQQVELLSDDF